MKEKTFEELLTGEVDFAPLMIGRETVLELLQQVREATIAECVELYVPDGNPENWLNKINDLPTDRIKTEK